MLAHVSSITADIQAAKAKEAAKEAKALAEAQAPAASGSYPRFILLTVYRDCMKFE